MILEANIELKRIKIYINYGNIVKQTLFLFKNEHTYRFLEISISCHNLVTLYITSLCSVMYSVFTRWKYYVSMQIRETSIDKHAKNAWA